MQEYKVRYYYLHKTNNRTKTKFFTLCYVDDELYCEEGPLFLEYNQNGKIREETWYKNGIKHREDGPASIDYDLDGNIDLIIWLKNGKRHREDGPAFIEYNRYSSLYFEYWYKNGLIHRDDGPAFTSYYWRTRTKETEKWYLNDKMTRLDNFAYIVYNPNGTVRYNWFHIGNISFSRLNNDLPKFIKFVGILKKIIWKYSEKKRKRIFEVLKDIKSNKINDINICILVSSFVY